MGIPVLNHSHHKAEPAPQLAQDASSTCIHCHREIKRVPGGQGSTWVHADTGAVVGQGEPVGGET